MQFYSRRLLLARACHLHAQLTRRLYGLTAEELARIQTEGNTSGNSVTASPMDKEPSRTSTWGEYVGEFRDGRPNGQGTYTYPDGRRYVGEWRDGDFNGRGTRTYPDGRKEVGEWRDGNFIGQGTLTYPEERKKFGKLGDNKFVNEPTNKLSNTSSEAQEATKRILTLLIQIVLLVIGAAIVTVYVIKVKSKPAVTPLISTSTHIGGPDEQSRVDDFQSVLLEAVEDFTIPDDKLLELRENARREFGELKELNRKGAMKRFFDFLKFW